MRHFFNIIFMEKRNKIYILLFLSVFWAIVIFVLCALPPGKLQTVRMPYFDKMAHFGIFFVQSLLLSLLFNFRTQKSFIQIVFLSTLIAFIYGGLIEILQSNFFNRSGEVLDLMADIFGAFAGAMIYPTIIRLFKRIVKRGT